MALSRLATAVACAAAIVFSAHSAAAEELTVATFVPPQHRDVRMVRAGAGLAVRPDCLVGEEINHGRLVQLLPDWQLDPIGVYVLWPQSAAKSGLAQRLVKHLAQFSPRSAGRG